MATASNTAQPNVTVCPRYHHAVELIGRKWTGAILSSMQMGRTRFTEIAAMVPGLSDRLLSERLKELESEGIVTRIVTPDTPVKIEYRLTDKGEALEGVTAAISEWAENWVALVPICDEDDEAIAATISS